MASYKQKATARHRQTMASPMETNRCKLSRPDDTDWPTDSSQIGQGVGRWWRNSQWCGIYRERERRHRKTTTHVTPLCIFSCRPIKNNSVTPYVFFMPTNKKQQCYPLCFFSCRPIKNDSVTPYVFFQQQCYPLWFFS